jgi:signal transduction histidine kinase
VIVRRAWTLHPPLRARVAVTFAVLCLVATVAVSAVSSGLARTYAVGQRDRLATSEAFSNARLVRDLLRAGGSAPDEVVDAMRAAAGTQVLLRYGDEWYTSAVSLSDADLPTSVTAAVGGGAAARQRFDNGNGTHLVVGVPLPSVGAAYYEVSSLAELRRTLSVLGWSLIVASAVTALVGAGAGLVIGRRLLRPLRRTSDAAVDIADGELDRRLDAEGDSDLEPLVQSFNHMADAIQTRIEREARFASDVSHELRTPLTTLATAIEVVNARSDEMPPRAATAVELLSAQVDQFERLVLDLLEISRLDAGVDRVAADDDVDLLALVGRISRVHGGPAVSLQTAGPWMLRIDERRVERVLANLFENAERYADGVTFLGLGRDAESAWIIVEDEGPGIDAADRDRAFDRFWRGTTARQRTSNGTGLGLALVSEHVRLMGGEVRLEGAAQ